MDNSLQYLILTENFGFELNTDILETNVINLILLLIILFVVIKNFLQENLGARKKKIVEGIEKAENSLADSRKRYNEAKKQWSQIALTIQEMNNQMEKTKQNVVKTKWDEAKVELSKRFNLAIEILRNREKKLFNEVVKEVSQKALTRVTNKLKNQLNKTEQSKIVSKKIKQLGD